MQSDATIRRSNWPMIVMVLCVGLPLGYSLTVVALCVCASFDLIPKAAYPWVAAYYYPMRWAIENVPGMGFLWEASLRTIFRIR